MRKFFTIWYRELTACFLSPIAYVIMVVFIAVSGGTFLTSLIREGGYDNTLSTMLFASIVVWLTVLITVVSMRLFAEEKRLGTIEALMTAPVTELEIVLGKYAGALSFILIVILPAIGNLFIFVALSPGLSYENIDIGSVGGGCVIIFLVSAFCIAIGLLISLMTKNQIVSAICCFSAIWLVLLTGWLVSIVPGSSYKFAEYISVMAHIEDFSRGSIDTRPIILYLSGTVFILFTAIRILESRKWR